MSPNDDKEIDLYNAFKTLFLGLFKPVIWDLTGDPIDVDKR